MRPTKQETRQKTRTVQLTFVFDCFRICLKIPLSLLLSSEDLPFNSVLHSGGNVVSEAGLVGALLFSPDISFARSWNFFTKSTLFSSIMA